MSSILSIKNLNKTYDGGFRALNDVNLEVSKGEIFALLGPNGAGKTTLIGCVCGLVNPTSGMISVSGHDVVQDFRHTRQLTGLVPQELTVDMFEPVWDTVSFSRGLFGMPRNDAHIESVLKKLSLWDKRKNSMMTLSGGMKRRVMIAKSLSHEPQLLFLDEPTAGVDVELRQNMWEQVKELQNLGVTIILTTHYIEEAEEMADRIGVINKGEIIVTENKMDLMKRMGHKEVTLDLNEPIAEIPNQLKHWALELIDNNSRVRYAYDSTKEVNGISQLLAELNTAGITYKDIHTDQSSLEDIFMKLVKSS